MTAVMMQTEAKWQDKFLLCLKFMEEMEKWSYGDLELLSCEQMPV